MIIVPVGEKRLLDAKKLIPKILKKADVVELRLDFMEDILVSEIEKLIYKYPLLLTFRSKPEGGKKLHSLKKRTGILKEIIDLKPAYLDLEYDRDSSLISYLKANNSKTCLILSFHQFKEPLTDVEKKLKEMKKIKAWKYKIACSHISTLDGMRMLILMKRFKDFIGISMGSHGYISRILGPVYNQPITYASFDECKALASGQVSVDELNKLYRYSKLNKSTKVLGIIGTPLNQSPGIRVYNSLFSQSKTNSIYLNFELEPHELKEFLSLAKKLHFYGLSVTIPHKEKVSAFVTQRLSSQKDICSINSLLFKRNNIFGMNSDGIGALRLFERHGMVKNKKVVIIGAGGTAHGLGFVLSNSGAKITFINRTDAKAKSLAVKFKAKWRSFTELDFLKESDYDILVHTTSVGMKDPSQSIVPVDVLHPNKIVFDAVFNDTFLVESARKKKCFAYNGKDFWVEQAAVQYELWHAKKDKNLKTKMKEKLL